MLLKAVGTGMMMAVHSDANACDSMTFDFGVANIPSHTSKSLPHYTFSSRPDIENYFCNAWRRNGILTNYLKYLKMPVLNGHFFYIKYIKTETKHKNDPKGILKFKSFLFLIKIAIPTNRSQ